jgi:hypothetical protein
MIVKAPWYTEWNNEIMTKVTDMSDETTLSKDDTPAEIDVIISGVTQQVFLAAGFNTT